MADDTDVAVLEPVSAEDSAQLDAEPVEPDAKEPEPDAQEAETERDFEAELQTAREEAAKEAREAALSEAAEQRNQQAYQQQRTQAQAYRTQYGAQQAHDLVGWAVDQALNGRDKADILSDTNRQVVGRLVNGFEAMVATEQWENLWRLFDQRVPKDWKPSQGAVEKLRSAEASRDPVRMFDAAFAYIEAYVGDTVGQAKAQELLKSEREKDKQAAAVQRTREGDQRRANADRPTAVGGGIGGTSISSMNEAAAAYNAGKITGAQYAEQAKRFGVSLD